MAKKKVDNQKCNNSKDKVGMEIKTPYPKEKEINEVYQNLGKLPPLKKESDINYWGEKMVKLQDRVNELELTISDMHIKLGRVADRLGM